MYVHNVKSYKIFIVVDMLKKKFNKTLYISIKLLHSYLFCTVSMTKVLTFCLLCTCV